MQNLYEFTVAFDGYFSICERNADIWSLVADWTYTSAMIQGENSWNNLRVDTSSQKLAGLCFISTVANPDYMMGIRLISELSTCLHVPHVAQNSRWDTTAFVCNPNDYQITVTFAYVDQNGDAKQTRMVWLPSTGFIRSLSATNDYAYP